MLPVHNFSYGLLTPVLAYAMSFLGAFLGLGYTTRALACSGASRARWLLLAALAIGAQGVWVMHFIAMLGYTVPGQVIRYDVPVTLVSILVAVVMVYAGLLLVGFGRGGPGPVLLAGLVTGIGVASMHYTGMSAMRMSAQMTYDPRLFLLSVLIAIVAATAAFCAALWLRGLRSTLAAAAIMAVAVSGMHYTGMAAMRLYPAPPGGGTSMGGGDTAASLLLPLIVGITVLAFGLAIVMALSPTAEEIREDAAMVEWERSRNLGSPK
jgi:NO-binding membrane sensor protein with MHYT domain